MEGDGGRALAPDMEGVEDGIAGARAGHGIWRQRVRRRQNWARRGREIVGVKAGVGKRKTKELVDGSALACARRP